MFMYSNGELFVCYLDAFNLFSNPHYSHMVDSSSCRFWCVLAAPALVSNLSAAALTCRVSLCLLLSVSWGMLPGLWFELFGAHCSGRGAQLPNHPCAYLLPDRSEEESHWLPVRIIPPCCFCLHLSLLKNTPPPPLSYQIIKRFPWFNLQFFFSFFPFLFVRGSNCKNWTSSLILTHPQQLPFVLLQR